MGPGDPCFAMRRSPPQSNDTAALRELARGTGEKGDAVDADGADEASIEAVPDDRRYGVRLGPSLIEGAGDGLFATRDIRMGETVAIYSGPIVDEDTGDNHYLLKLPGEGNGFIDGTRPLFPDAHLGRFANHAAWSPDHRPLFNVKFVFDKNVERNPRRFVKLVATRPVRKGEEIYVNYGPEYWTDESPSDVPQ